MIKKYSLYALIALLGTASIDTGAILQSQIPAVRNYVTNFVTQWMNQLFNQTQQSFTSGYNIGSDGNNVDVQRIPSTTSISPARASARFNQAITVIVDAILDIFDENGPAEGIRVSALNNNQNAYRFTPHFMGSFESDSGEDTEEDNDNQNIGKDNANTVPYNDAPAANAA